MPPPLPWGGGCQCGRVRYRVTSMPLTLYACHCRECRRAASSAFGMSMRVPRDGLLLDRSQLAVWRRDEGTATEVEGWFCPDCGVRIVHARAGRDTVNVKPGTLDDADWLDVAGHLWTDRALPFVAIDPALPAYPRQPQDYDELIAAWSARIAA